MPWGTLGRNTISSTSSVLYHYFGFISASLSFPFPFLINSPWPWGFRVPLLLFCSLATSLVVQYNRFCLRMCPIPFQGLCLISSQVLCHPGHPSVNLKDAIHSSYIFVKYWWLVFSHRYETADIYCRYFHVDNIHEGFIKLGSLLQNAPEKDICDCVIKIASWKWNKSSKMISIAS